MTHPRPNCEINVSFGSMLGLCYPGDYVSGDVNIDFHSDVDDVEFVKVELIGTSSSSVHPRTTDSTVSLAEDTVISYNASHIPPPVKRSTLQSPQERHQLFYDCATVFPSEGSVSSNTDVKSLRTNFCEGSQISESFEFLFSPVAFCLDRTGKHRKSTNYATSSHESFFGPPSQHSTDLGHDPSTPQVMSHDGLPPSFCAWDPQHPEVYVVVEYYILVTVKSAEGSMMRKFPLQMMEAPRKVSEPWYHFVTRDINLERFELIEHVVEQEAQPGKLTKRSRFKRWLRKLLKLCDTKTVAHPHITTRLQLVEPLLDFKIVVRQPLSFDRAGERVKFQVYILSNRTPTEYCSDDEDSKFTKRGTFYIQDCEVRWVEHTTVKAQDAEFALEHSCNILRSVVDKHIIDLSQLKATSSISSGLSSEYDHPYAIDISHCFQQVRIPDVGPGFEFCNVRHVYHTEIAMTLADCHPDDYESQNIRVELFGPAVLEPVGTTKVCE